MKWSEFKETVNELLLKETSEENNDPDICSINISAGMMQVNKELIIHIEDGELEIF